MMIYSTYTLDLVRALESTSPASCKTPTTSTDSICPNNRPRRNRNPEKRSSSQQIISHCLGLRTQNTGLREKDWEPSPKTDYYVDKINRLIPKTKDITENKSYSTSWTYK